MNHRHLRRGAPLLAAAAAALTATAAIGPGDARASGTPACAGSQLVTTIAPARGGATAGTFYYDLKFTNLGRTCTLRGYPGLSAVGISGRRLGRAAVHQRGAARTVTLRAPTSDSASSATAVVGFVDTGNFGGSCHQQLAAGLRVYAPGSTRAASVPFVFDACSRGSDAFLKVAPIR